MVVAQQVAVSGHCRLVDGNREDTRVQAKGSAENLATREAMWDDYFDKTLTIGTVEVPVLIGFNPETIRGWDLRPYDLPNSFETIVPGK
jgi:hypothetical protein